MRRWDVVVLLIAGLVICPIDCWALATASRQSQVSVEVQPAASADDLESCCRGCQREPTSGVPLGEGPCKGSGNDCICKAGPVVVKLDKMQPLACSLFRSGTTATIHVGEPLAASGQPLWSFQGTWGACSGGRTVRILLNSFLA